MSTTKQEKTIAVLTIAALNGLFTITEPETYSFTLDASALRGLYSIAPLPQKETVNDLLLACFKEGVKVFIKEFKIGAFESRLEYINFLHEINPSPEEMFVAKMQEVFSSKS